MPPKTAAETTAAANNIETLHGDFSAELALLEAAEKNVKTTSGGLQKFTFALESRLSKADDTQVLAVLRQSTQSLPLERCQRLTTEILAARKKLADCVSQQKRKGSGRPPKAHTQRRQAIESTLRDLYQGILPGEVKAHKAADSKRLQVSAEHNSYQHVRSFAPHGRPATLRKPAGNYSASPYVPVVCLLSV